MPLTFEQWKESLQTLLRGPLPGSAAHEPMRAVATGLIRPDFNHKLPPRPGSVLILLYPVGNKIMFPLTKRPEYTGTHSGQISLPGGKAEEGETHIETALREAKEEIGIDPAHAEVIGTLSPFFVIPSNFMVTPVVATMNERPSFAGDPVEVVRIVEGSLTDLVREDAVHVSDIMAARVYPLRAPHFLVEGEIVWGATAMMLNELRVLLRELPGSEILT